MFTDNLRNLSLQETGQRPRWDIDLADPKLLSQVNDLSVPHLQLKDPSNSKLDAQHVGCNCHNHADAGKVPINAKEIAEASKMPVADITVNDYKDDTKHKKIIVFNIDLSGSMSDSGMQNVLTDSKFSVAMAAMKRALKKIPDGTEIEIRAFGPRTLNEHSNILCEQSAVLIPRQLLCDKVRDHIKEEMKGWEPGNETPLTYSMRQVETVDLADVGNDVDVTEILISDGGESCGEKPCDYMKELRKHHPNWKVRIIGLNLTDDVARDTFDCMVNEGGAEYKDAHDVESLTNGLLDSAEVHAQIYHKPADNANPNNF